MNTNILDFGAVADAKTLCSANIQAAIEEGDTEFTAYVVKDGALKEFQLKMAELTPDEKDIILKGCLINYYRG